ncbi:MAG: zinc ribbon domain-containing protein [Dissulfurispiraceae bacterium]
MWGRVVTFARYKGLKREKLTIKIPAHGTSQECSQCGHIHPDNRETQAMFTCQKCGFTLNADYNASLVIKRRGIKMLRNGEITAKGKKTVVFRKQKSDSQIGLERSESTCVEIMVRRVAGGTRTTQRSMIRKEAPTSTAVGS